MAIPKKPEEIINAHAKFNRRIFQAAERRAETRLAEYRKRLERATRLTPEDMSRVLRGAN